VYEKKKQEIEHELADVLLAITCFANVYDIDLSSIFKEKLALVKAKYPIEKVKGKHHKYTEYK
jgi:NTP pyrophosphatase (non-canonical NTP hydrolase)